MTTPFVLTTKYKGWKLKSKLREKADAELIKNYDENKVQKLSEVSYEETQKFYRTKEWKELFASFREKNKDVSKCPNCGRAWSEKIIMIADHICPVKFFWHLRLEESNLQVLCKGCNKAKLNKVGPYALEALKTYAEEIQWKQEKENRLLLEIANTKFKVPFD